MANRISLWLSTVFWLVMMFFLVRADVLPSYVVADNPGYDEILKKVEAPILREMVVYQGDMEVGTSTTAITPNADGTYGIVNSTNVDVKVASLSSRVRSILEVSLDKDRELRRIWLTVTAGDNRADVTGIRQGDVLTLKASLNGQEFTEEVPYEKGMVSSYFDPFALGGKLKEGQHWQTRFLDPLSQQFTTATIEVAGKETVRLSLREGEALRDMEVYKLVMTAGTIQLFAWANEDGVILKEETPMGYTLVYREGGDDDSTSQRIEILRNEMRRQ